MKKSSFKRFGLGLLQHILAAGIMLAVAGLLLNSHVLVNSIDGAKVYKIFPADMGVPFEESEIYHDLFRNAVSDITRLVAIKRQLETDGIFDPSKEIDITASAKEIGADKGCDITAVYELDNLIKWGKYGVEYTNRYLSMSDFVNYFGDCIYPENFELDEFGQLMFDDFYRVDGTDGHSGGRGAGAAAGSEGGAAGGGTGGIEGGAASGGTGGSGGDTATGGTGRTEGSAASGGTGGSGEAAATGGTGRTEGSAAPGGTGGSGGGTATGGTGRTEGSAASGGTGGSGEVAATGGTGRTEGSASSGGTGGSGGGTAPGNTGASEGSADSLDAPEETDWKYSGKSEEELDVLAAKMEEYSLEQLEDLVFSHIMAEKLSDIEVSREDDASIVVYVPLLNCRYDTAEGERQLTGYADNWIDYMHLQENTVAVVEDIASNYQSYQVCNDAYKDENSNVKYMVRMMTDSGMCTYTNRPELAEAEDDFVTESFNEYRWYLIYYPDSLVFMGNTILSEEEIDGYISNYAYAYPDTTHIWLGVDANYAVEGDAFQSANAVYQKIVPNINRILGVIALMAAVWAGLGIYLTITTGLAVSEGGEQVWYLSRFDRIWTEVFLVLVAGFVFGGVYGYGVLMDIAGNAGAVTTLAGIQLTKLYQYGLFGVYGLYVSIAFQIVWYSLARRIKVGNLWQDSLTCCICRGLENSVKFIFRHKNSVISVLLPYNAFLFTNLAGILAIYILRGQGLPMFLLLVSMIALDGFVGVFLFRHNAEQGEIVEGIKRIRDGEVEFQLDADTLHGSSRELADAVNNIGEGIKKAVSTSMKDEQMKTDLITNVSHDIKTPLTSIINYVDLLKRLKIQEEPAKGYIEILDGKTQRLKQLTDDLVEASKISSGNIVLDMEKLNLTELLNQGIGEFSERMEECRLTVVFESGDAPAYIYADSSRMWRVVENLFNNVCKYALEGTRIYIDVARREERVEVSVKNISRQQMNIRSEELTERFIRGDSSRTTEGSGLGLYIAKSLVQVQGGGFEILLDGDLFKTVFSFAAYEGE